MEATNDERFGRIEVSQASKEHKLTQILKTLLQRRESPRSHHGGSILSKQPLQVRNVKLEFPRFDGKKVMDWIFKAEQFFDYYDTPDLDRITIAYVHLDQDSPLVPNDAKNPTLPDMANAY